MNRKAPRVPPHPSMMLFACTTPAREVGALGVVEADGGDVVVVCVHVLAHGLQTSAVINKSAVTPHVCKLAHRERRQGC